MSNLRKAAEMALEALETEPDQLHPAQWGQDVKALRQSLYPQKREWVGLTKEERHLVLLDVPHCRPQDFLELIAQAVESKLKEKNRGGV